MLPGEYTRIFAEEEHYWWYVGRRSILHYILRRHVKSKVPLAVDIGCGTGMNFAVLSNYAHQLSGADTSPVALAYCRQRGWHDIRRVSAVNGPLPYDESSAGLVTLFDTLEHAPDDRHLLSEVHRILKPGGLVIITVPAYQFLWSEHDEALRHHRRYRRAPLIRHLVHQGFTVRKASYCITIFFPLIVLYRALKGLLNLVHPTRPQTSHVHLPAGLNRAFSDVLKIEGWLLQYLNLPFGTSIVVVAEKGATA